MQTYPPRLTNQVIAEIGMTGWVSEPFFCLVQKLPPTFSTYPSIRPAVRLGGLRVRGKIKNSLLLCLWCMFKVEAQRTESWATLRKPKDRRNGQLSGVERRSLNPAPSFLLLFCGKKVG
ncbi:MAG: hypothetical protein RL432_1391 [Bacteroidota bacterium]|jgi:hypothetical protein